MANFTINHIGMALPSIEKFLERSRAVYGGFERGPLIVNQRQRVREMFVTDGRTRLELLEPLEVGSPLDGFLDANPNGGLLHIAIDVDHLEPALAELTAAGGRVVTPPIPDVAFEERRIAFVYIGGQMVELIERG